MYIFDFPPPAAVCQKWFWIYFDFYWKRWGFLHCRESTINEWQQAVRRRNMLRTTRVLSETALLRSPNVASTIQSVALSSTSVAPTVENTNNPVGPKNKSFARKKVQATERTGKDDQLTGTLQKVKIRFSKANAAVAASKAAWKSGNKRSLLLVRPGTFYKPLRNL